MMLAIFGALIVISLIGMSHETSTPQSPNYEAGVVEFNFGPMPGLNSTQILEINLNKYLEIMENAPSTLDIIVFPESTLNSMLTAPVIPEPKENISPCDVEGFGDLLTKISCSAKQYQRYVVINISTKIKCPDADMIAQNDPRNCSRADGNSYYNTNVVFDRKGVVISRYRKFNLFGESVDKPFKPTMETFDTDFGVTFGHFVCFDLMFRKPALELIRTNKVTDIVFATMWFSELPFLTAVQVQQYWAQSNNANLLAAGANFPGVGSTGTGIYAGKKGALVGVMYGANETNLYTATVPKINFPGNENIQIRHNVVKYTANEMKPLYLKRDQLDRYDIEFLNDSDGNHEVTKRKCEGDLCCDFKLNFTISNSESKSHYQYALAFYHNNRTFDGFADGGVVACAILACSTKEISSCGVRNEVLENIHTWNSIDISGTFPTTNGQFFYIPSILDSSILPLQPDLFHYEAVEKSNDKVEIKMKLTDSNEHLLTFGIYGRDFNLDDNDGVANLKALPLLITILIAGLFIRKFL